MPLNFTFLTKSFIVIDYPFTIGGICKSSTTAQGMTGGHRGELKTAPHLHLRGHVWDKKFRNTIVSNQFGQNLQLDL